MTDLGAAHCLLSSCLPHSFHKSVDRSARGAQLLQLTARPLDRRTDPRAPHALCGSPGNTWCPVNADQSHDLCDPAAWHGTRERKGGGRPAGQQVVAPAAAQQVSCRSVRLPRLVFLFTTPPSYLPIALAAMWQGREEALREVLAAPSDAVIGVLLAAGRDLPIAVPCAVLSNGATAVGSKVVVRAVRAQGPGSSSLQLDCGSWWRGAPSALWMDYKQASARPPAAGRRRRAPSAGARTCRFHSHMTRLCSLPPTLGLAAAAVRQR